MAISLQIYNLLSKLPKNYPKKDDDEHEYDLTQKFFIISHRNHGNHRKAMRHDYPHAEAQRAQRSHRYFISNTDLPDSTD